MLEAPLSVGGMIASNAILPDIGFLLVTGIYLLNRTSHRSLVETTVGPVATIAAGVLTNFFYFIGVI